MRVVSGAYNYSPCNWVMLLYSSAVKLGCCRSDNCTWILICQHSKTMIAGANLHDLHCALCGTLWQSSDVPGESGSLDVAEVRERLERSLAILPTDGLASTAAERMR